MKTKTIKRYNISVGLAKIRSLERSWEREPQVLPVWLGKGDTGWADMPEKALGLLGREKQIYKVKPSHSASNFPHVCKRVCVRMCMAVLFAVIRSGGHLVSLPRKVDWGTGIYEHCPALRGPGRCGKELKHYVCKGVREGVREDRRERMRFIT